ncbi:ankyrin-2-like [Armigeres subalbatus]|uniref:ankyrin-2-like n=1 Tax=Armigeres subalbatus TaxID=124917 RepID=UPI002ED61EFC
MLMFTPEQVPKYENDKAQPIDPDLTAKMLGRGVAVSPVVTVEPRRRKFHKAITLSMPAPRAHSQGMINQYSGNAPTLRLLCSITGGTTRAQWEDVTGSTPLTFVNDCVSFTTTVSARFWLMDCRNIADATKMATELYKEAIHVPFMAKFVVFAKRTDPLEARLRVFCMTDDREDKTLEHQEHFTEVAKSRDVEVLEDKPQYIELAGNLIPITKSGEQLSLAFKAFRENRLPFAVRVKDQHADIVGRTLFMREPKIAKGEPPQQPICILNIVLPETIIPDHTTTIEDSQEIVVRVGRTARASPRDQNYLGELRVVDISNLLGEDWVKLAPEIGISDTDVENIIAQNPTSSAQQAQVMLKQFQSKTKNDFNILENGLRTIHRDDIVDRCLRSSTTTTTTVTMRNKTAFSISKRSHDVDIIAESDSIAKLVQKDDNQYAKEESSKYSVEEKHVEESEESEEETIKKTVAERRKQIEKRLSADRSIPASLQKKEIVEEIITIKRSSMIDDTRAKHEEEILMQKPIDNSYKSSVIPEPVVKLKTTHLKDGSSVPKDEFDKELQDKFKSTLKNVEEFEHKSQILTTEKVDTSAKIVDEIAKKDAPEFTPKPDEQKSSIDQPKGKPTPEEPKIDHKKPHDGDDDDDDHQDKPPVPKERVPIPTKRTSVIQEDETSEVNGVVSESTKKVQERISSFETKSSESSKRTSWTTKESSSSGSKQWSEEQEILSQKSQLEATEAALGQWTEEQEILAQKAELEAAETAPGQWTEEDEILAQQKQFEQLAEQQSTKLSEMKTEGVVEEKVQWSEEQEILAQKAQLEKMEKNIETKLDKRVEEEVRKTDSESATLSEKKFKETVAEKVQWTEEQEILSQKAQFEKMEKTIESKLDQRIEGAVNEADAFKQQTEQVLEEQMKHQKGLIQDKFDKMGEEFQSKVAEEKKGLFEKFEQKTAGFKDLKSEGHTKIESMDQQFQEKKSEVFSKVEEKVTSVTSKAESFAESFKTDTKKIDGLDDGFRQAVQEFTAQSSETKTFVDEKIDTTVKEIRDSEVVSEVQQSTQKSKETIDKVADAVAKETIISSEQEHPSVQEAFTKESFASVREEVTSKDITGTLKESAEKTTTEVETGIRQGTALIAEKISEIGEEFRRTEETPAIKPDDKPSIVETVKKTVTQEVTSKIPVFSKRTSPDEPAKPKEEPKLEKEPEPTKEVTEPIVDAAQTVVKQVEAAVSKIPRFFESSKPATQVPETTTVKSPEPEVTTSKIPIFKDRKVSEQVSSDSCETVIMQKTLHDQDSFRKSDSDEKQTAVSTFIGEELCEEITSREAKEVLSFTTIDETVLNELITEDERAVTPDDFIDEIIEEAQDKVQQIQDTEIAAYTLDLSKSEDDVHEKSPHTIPEYVTERYERDYEDHDEEHEKWQDDAYSVVPDNASTTDFEAFREYHWLDTPDSATAAQTKLTKSAAQAQTSTAQGIVLASTEDLDTLSLQSPDIVNERKQRSQATQDAQDIDEPTRASKARKDFNLDLDSNTTTRHKPDRKTHFETHSNRGTSPMTDIVESPDSVHHYARGESPAIKLVIGRKEIKTSDTSAITESRLTVYGHKDVEISISSQSTISLTTTTTSKDGREVSSEVISTGTNGKDSTTTKRYKQFKLIDDDEDSERVERKRDDTVSFSKKKSVYLFGSFDSSSESPITEASGSGHVTDTGISLTRGFTETMTSPGIVSSSEEKNKKISIVTDTAVDVEIEELELTDAGLSPILPDETDITADFQITEEDVHFAHTGTSPVDFDEHSVSAALDTSEAGTLTDRVETKDASNSPLDAHVTSILKRDLTKMTDEELLTGRRGSGDVKAKIKILEQNQKIHSAHSSPKKKVEFEDHQTKHGDIQDSPKKQKVASAKINELKRLFGEEQQPEESNVMSESIPPIHEVIKQLEQRIAVEQIDKKVLEHVDASAVRTLPPPAIKKETLTDRDIVDLEAQIIPTEKITATKAPILDQTEEEVKITKLVHGVQQLGLREQRQRDLLAEEREIEAMTQLEEPVCEKIVCKKYVPELTEDAIEEFEQKRANDLIKMFESKQSAPTESPQKSPKHTRTKPDEGPKALVSAIEVEKTIHSHAILTTSEETQQKRRFVELEKLESQTRAIGKVFITSQRLSMEQSIDEAESEQHTESEIVAQYEEKLKHGEISKLNRSLLQMFDTSKKFQTSEEQITVQQEILHKQDNDTTDKIYIRIEKVITVISKAKKTEKVEDFESEPVEKVAVIYKAKTVEAKKPASPVSEPAKPVEAKEPTSPVAEPGTVEKVEKVISEAKTFETKKPASPVAEPGTVKEVEEVISKATIVQAKKQASPVSESNKVEKVEEVISEAKIVEDEKPASPDAEPDAVEKVEEVFSDDKTAKAKKPASPVTEPDIVEKVEEVAELISEATTVEAKKPASPVAEPVKVEEDETEPIEKVQIIPEAKIVEAKKPASPVVEPDAVKKVEEVISEATTVEAKKPVSPVAEPEKVEEDETEPIEKVEIIPEAKIVETEKPASPVEEVISEAKIVEPEKTASPVAEPDTAEKVEEVISEAKIVEPEKPALPVAEPEKEEEDGTEPIEKIVEAEKPASPVSEPDTVGKVEKAISEATTVKAMKLVSPVSEPDTVEKVEEVILEDKTVEAKKQALPVSEPDTVEKVEKVILEDKTVEAKKPASPVVEADTVEKVEEVISDGKTVEAEKPASPVSEPDTVEKMEEVISEAKIVEAEKPASPVAEPDSVEKMEEVISEAKTVEAIKSASPVSEPDTVEKVEEVISEAKIVEAEKPTSPFAELDTVGKVEEVIPEVKTFEDKKPASPVFEPNTVEKWKR